MNQRLIGLDLLRFVAVILVIFSHLQMIDGAPGWIWPYTRYGSLGVSLFFVLSGFLVSGLLFAEHKKRGEISIRRFYVRRAWKIYPPFYLLLVISYFYSLWVVGWKVNDRIIFAELFFIQNYRPGYWNHTWSLAVEEHFYIVLPLLLAMLLRRNRMAVNPFTAIPAIVAAVVVAVTIARTVNFQLNPKVDLYTHAFPTHLRVEALFFGVLLAYIYHYYSFEPLRRWRHAMMVLGAAVALTPTLIASRLPEMYGWVFAFSLEFLGSAAVLVGVMLCEIPRTGLTVLLAKLGSYSYSIYLWHMAVIYWVKAPWHITAPLYLVGSFVIGIGMALLWELPTLKLRDRYFPSRLAQPAPAAAA